MAENSGTLESLTTFAGDVLEPLTARLSSGEIGTLFAELGYDFGDQLDAASDLLTAGEEMATDVRTILGALQSLATLIEDEDYAGAALAVADLVQFIPQVFQDFDQLKAQLEAFELSMSDIDHDAFVDFCEALPKRLTDYLVVTYLENTTVGIVEALEFIGAVVRTDMNEDSTDPANPPYTKRELDLGQLFSFISSPSNHLNELYGWGSETFDGTELLSKLGDMLNSFGLPSYLDTDVAPTTLDLYLFAISTNTQSPPGLDIAVQEDITTSLVPSASGDGYEVEVTMDAELEVGGTLSIQPSGDITLTPELGTPSGKLGFKLTLTPRDGEDAIVILGQPGASRLECQQFEAEASVGLEWDGTKAVGTWGVEAEMTGGKLVISAGEADGFLSSLLPAEGIEVDFDFGMGYSSTRGFYFTDSGQLEVNLPVSLTLGPVTISQLSVGLAPGEDALEISLGADISATLGPFSAVVEGIGISANISFPEDRSGNLGFAHFELGFQPPRGVGMSLDAGAVKGGGYLYFDTEKGEYAGAIELSFQDSISFSAIGIVTTQMPDGSDGYSLLIMVNVTWSTPLPLGLNFYLSGVGGLLGLHRTVDVDRMRQGVQDGSLDNILFPEDVIANITTIITDLKEAFPIQQDQFVVGVMARITWSTPALLTADLGLIIEFSDPVRLLILGVVKLQLPNPDSAIVNIQVNFLGVIDFEAGMLSFDAEIVNSTILALSLEGSMALRLSWGEQKDFLVSVGGFHPAYEPPAYLDLPTMKRMSLSLLKGNPSLKLSAYFAVTTNTVQLGAALDFYFKVSKFEVVGEFGLDVIFIFNPFSFEAAMHASVAVRWGDTDLLSITCKLVLSGPSPWRAKGTGEFKVLGIKCSVNFDTTFGERKDNSLPATEVLPLLLEELEKDENWGAEIPDERYDAVTYSSDSTALDAVLVRPNAGISVRQRILPLEMDFSLFGAYVPSDISRAEITALTVGGESQALEDLYDAFAPAAYKEMSDADKLASPSYNDEKSGKQVVGTGDISLGYSINRAVTYDVIVSDYEADAGDLSRLGPLSAGAGLFHPLVGGGAVGRSPQSRRIKRSRSIVGNRVSIGSSPIVIANVSDLKAYGGTTLTFATKAEADDYLVNTLYANDPSLQGQLQLVPEYQVVPTI